MGAPWKIVIAAGGTGGHISPALAIGEHLARADPDCAPRYVCGARPVEIEIYRKAGIEPKIIEVEQLGRSLFALLTSVFRLRRSIAKARAWIREERPQVVLGTGGYVCVPTVAAAAGEGIPTLIHESNSVAGRANRWLARRATAVAVGYAEAARGFPPAKTRVTGIPVRPEFVGADRAEALRRWDLREGTPVLLVFGGSQGARRVNEAVLEALPLLDEAAAGFGGIQLLWSCGEKNYAEISEQLNRLVLTNSSVRQLPFIREMGLAYAAANLAITRAGAMTLAELTANALPAIVIPLPGAMGGHQALNALPLAKAGAVLVIGESELDGKSLGDSISGLLTERSQLEQMKHSARSLGRPRAVEEIVEMILQLRGKYA